MTRRLLLLVPATAAALAMGALPGCGGHGPDHAEGDATASRPAVPSRDEVHQHGSDGHAHGAPPAPSAETKPYVVDVTSSPVSIRPGVPTGLTFRIIDPDGQPVSRFETVHEKILHLLVVTNDLSWFAHEHPKLSGGQFTLDFTFPTPGPYVLYHDFTPAEGRGQVVPVDLVVPGTPPAPRPLRVDTDTPKAIDGYVIEFRSRERLTTGALATVEFAITRDGRPVTDLQPYLGAMGHLVMISGDRTHFVHSHPLGGGHGAAAHGGHDEPGSEAAGVVGFQATFPTPGVYKAWGQFRHEDRVLTAPFVFEVGPETLHDDRAARR